MPEKRKSAFIRATQEAQTGATADTLKNTVTPLQGETVAPSSSEPVPPPQETSTSPKKDKKLTVYLTQEQQDKLDGLEIQYYQRQKKKVNRMEIVRYLIDRCDINDLQSL